MFASPRAQVLAEVPYSQVEDVEIGGPGLVKSGGGFSGGGFGLGGAIEGMAIAVVLNALTTRTSVQTVVRIQATGCELFLLHTRLTPEQLRIQMSPPLAAIRSARAAAAQDAERPGSPFTSRGTRKASRHAGKRPADPRGIRPDESKNPRYADVLTRTSPKERSSRTPPSRHGSHIA